MDTFKGQAINNNFQAQQAGLDDYSYAQALQQAQQNALGANGMANNSAGYQSMLAQDLMAQAHGQGPSLAQLQLQQAQDQNNKMAAGAIAAQRGMNPAQQARLILQNQAAGNMAAGNASAQLRMQEQLGAQSQLGNALANQRGQDIGQMQANAGLFNTAGGLQGQQNANRIQNLGMAQGINAQVAAGNQQAAMQAQQMTANASANSTAAAAQASAAKMQAITGVVGGTVGGAGAVAAKALAHGGPVDSYKNDTVPAMLSPGEIVIPRSVAQADDAPEKAREFVEAIKKSKQPEEGYGKVLAKQREMADRLKRLEMMAFGGVVRGC